MKIHVSGNTFADQDYFNRYYRKQLTKLVEDGVEIYLGGASGIDQLTQQFCLDQKIDPKRVHVYDKGDQDNRLDPNFNHLNGFSSYTERDQALTDVTDQDLAFVHGGGSGTFSNIIRRQFGAETARSIQKLFRKHASDYKNKEDLILI